MFFLFLFRIDLYALEVKVVILDFTANGVPQAEAEIARNRFEVALFSRSDVRILERTEYQKKIRLYVDSNGCQEKVCAARIGKVLSADYVILGSLDKVADYSFNIRMVEVKSGNIVYAVTDKFENSMDIAKTADYLSERLNRRLAQIKKSGPEKNLSPHNNPEVSVAASFLQPLDLFSEKADSGFALKAGFSYGESWLLFFDAGSFGFMKGDGSYYASIFSLSLGAGYRINILPFELIPVCTFGPAYSKIWGLEKGAIEPFFSSKPKSFIPVSSMECFFYF